MATKKISVKNATIKILTGYLPYIGRYIPGALKESDLPIKVILQDPETNDEFEAELISVVPFNQTIPEVFSLLSDDVIKCQAESFYFDLLKVSQISSLAFYLYRHVK